MAKTRDYMDYLDEKISIAPASSQEELEAAELIAGIMGDHGLSPSVEEFDTSPHAGVVRPILQIMLFASASFRTKNPRSALPSSTCCTTSLRSVSIRLK